MDVSRTERARTALAPWAGMIGGALGGILAHQGGADSVFNNCAGASPGPVLVLCLLGLVIVGGGAVLSWTARGDGAKGSARGLIATVSTLLAVLVAFAITLPMIAALVIPPCHA